MITVPFSNILDIYFSAESIEYGLAIQTSALLDAKSPKISVQKIDNIGNQIAIMKAANYISQVPNFYDIFDKALLVRREQRVSHCPAVKVQINQYETKNTYCIN